jgi:hypothetical protein
MSRQGSPKILLISKKFKFKIETLNKVQLDL